MTSAQHVYDVAIRSKNRLARDCTDDMIDQIVDTMIVYTDYPIWMSVFRDDPVMIQKFVNAMVMIGEVYTYSNSK